MLEQALLREQFETLLDQHQQAVGQYEAAVEKANDQAREQLEALYRQKKRHIELTERLIEILD